jgi:predicted metal-binding protein
MVEKVKVGIIICARYQTCTGGKCLRSLRQKEGAFSGYEDKEVELVGFTTCGGCPGGNVEYAPEEMKRNGAEVIHLATGFLVGFPPCPHLEYFLKTIPGKFDLKVVAGTHPLPQKYFAVHQRLGSWNSAQWAEILKPCLVNETVRKSYD